MTIWQTCGNDSFECGAGITLICSFFLVFVINLVFFVKSYRVNQTLTYELVAVFIASIDGITMMLYELFFKNVITVLISTYFELLIFSLINFCFVIGFFILLMGETFKSKTLRAFFWLFWIMITIILITGLIGSPEYDCDNRFEFHWLFFTVCNLIMALNSFIFGILLFRVSWTKQKETTPDQDSKLIGDQHFFAQQRKILLTLSVSFTIAIFLVFIFDLDLRSLMETTDDVTCQDSVTLSLNTMNVKVVAFLRSLAWLLPLIMLPVCLYIIPYLDEKKWRNDIAALDFDANHLDNSFLGSTPGNNGNNNNKKLLSGLNRDTVLFNKSQIGKNSLNLYFDRSFTGKSVLDKDKSFMEKIKKADL